MVIRFMTRGSAPGWAALFDMQANPAYNTDRGNVHVSPSSSL
jgi:hypothetical protein